MSALVRPRPLVAVVFRVPLFIEALSAAFEGLADVQALNAADGELQGLLGALHPDAVVVEASDEPAVMVDVPLVHVDLDLQAVRSRTADDEWVRHDIELSGESIRNVVLAAIFVVSER